ncbi:MAG: SxtJ family membrane protein [Planctomycetaceae bacterium]
MALANLNLNPSSRQLKQFGGICVIAIPLLAWLWTRSLPVAGWSAVAGVVAGLIALAAPKLLRPVFILLMVLTFPIGLVVGEIAMLLIYVTAFVPLALIFRLIGRDSLQRHRKNHPATFWETRSQPASAKSYYRQF